MDSETEARKDDIHRKIGRNVVVLRRVELLLKHLVAKGNFTLRSNPDDPDTYSFKNQLEQIYSSVRGKTMGCVSERFKESILAEPPSFPKAIDNEEGNIVLSLGITNGTHKQQKELKSKLNAIVNERNRLIHELLTSFNLTTSDAITTGSP